ncbi:MAG: hypothetical protein HN455_04010 [Gammaproteobacteria bacterium]|nr:hypothetical protein [Gammaproteobacteria bacterium]MBT6878500.1 hypothetical protein [Gammaproteobacteria bacterium]HIJ26595.1 hypothetical protein [Gammaproteobacteria bacterium]
MHEGTSLTLEEILAPARNTTFFQRDYFHRVATVQFAILFQQWMAHHEYGLIDMGLYFNRRMVNGQYVAATRTQ